MEKLDVGGQVWTEWDEAIETEVDLGVTPLLAGPGAARAVPFSFPATATTEPVSEAGRLVRATEAIGCEVRMRAQPAEGAAALVKVTIEVENTTPWSDPTAGRDEVVRRSLIAVHTLAAVEDGSFCSALDPPAGAAEAVARCRSVGSYPVLVGPAGATDVVLASPIILYDYPAIAPESEGDFHDGLEIDELLALRVLTLTEAEKAEARGTDSRARAIIDRCDGMVLTSFDRLHGKLRDLRAPAPEADGPPPMPWMDPAVDAQFDPWSDVVTINETRVTKGSRVRLRPKRGADLHDMFLAGLTATVAGVFYDLDGGCQVAVTIDSDPAAELLERQGRFSYFRPEEIEPLAASEGGLGKGAAPRDSPPNGAVEASAP